MSSPVDTVWDQIRGWIAAIVFICLGGAAVWYLTNAPYEIYEPKQFGGLAPLIIVIVVFVGGMAGGKIMDQMNWHGPLPAAVPEGYAWRRSIRSRLEILANLFWLIFLREVFFMPYAAWQHQDWGRMVFSGLAVIAIVFFTVLALQTALRTDLVLIIDDEGFRDGVKPRLNVRWADVERFSVAGDLGGRTVSVFEDGADGKPGRYVTVDLAGAGISVRTFLDRAAEIAPGIDVTTPASRMADFSAA